MKPLSAAAGCLGTKAMFQGKDFGEGDNMRVKTERKDRKKERWRKKSIQVFLITTAEKTATKRKMKERGLEDRKSQSLAEKRFFWFRIFQIIILWSVSGCTCICKCLNVCMHSA